MSDLALNGGTPVRRKTLAYGGQWVDDEDIASVVEVLRSEWLTTGPRVPQFEQAFAAAAGAPEAVVVNSGTAALHAAVFAAGIGPGDEVIVPAMTFAASANCVVYQGATPVFADVEPDTLLLDLNSVRQRLTPLTRALIAVDYAGQPCDYDALRTVAMERENLMLIADACHALGASYKGRPVGSLADLNTFSLHPVKPITAGEGGAITTDDPQLAQRMRVFRNHGITTDFRQRETVGSWFYEMAHLGFNYRLSDIQCALGLSQLRKLATWTRRRQAIASRYDAAFAGIPQVRPLRCRPAGTHAYHLYVVRINVDGVDRGTVFAALRAEGIGVNVHYVPVYLHPFYRERFGTGTGLCPVAEAAYGEILSLPIFPRMSDDDVADVIHAVEKVVSFYLRQA